MHRYCLFSALYAPHMGGVETYTAKLAHELAARGHDVAVVTSRLSEHDPAREHQADGVDVYRLPARALLGGRLPLPRRTGGYAALLDEVAARKPDRVVVNTRFYPHSQEGVELARRVGAQALVIDHGSAHLSLGNALLDRFVQRYEHRRTDALVACGVPFAGVSRASVEWLRHFGIEGVGVVPNAIDVRGYADAASGRDFRAELGIAGDEVLVCSIGRYTPEKGIGQLLCAASMLEDEPVHLAFAGTGPLQRDVEAAASAGGRVHELGRLEPSDVAALLRGSDALCLPSRSEGFATVLLEAAAMGTAPVTTDVGGVAELGIRDGRGMLLAGTDPDGIVAALRRVLDDPEACSEMGARLRDHALATVGWEHSADALEALFETV